MSAAKKPSRALVEEWDRKLKEAGFDDIEWTDGKGERDGGYLKRHYLHTAKRVLENVDRAELMRKSGWWVHDNAWRSRRDKRIFELHAEGMSLREIQENLTVRTSIANIHRIITENNAKLLEHYDGGA